jgi:probable F420-dependent oxidoreductase
MPHEPRLTISLPSYSAEEPDGWGRVVDRARAADEVGVDRVVVSDHVAFGEHLEAYARPELGGTEGGRQPTGPDGHWLEPLTVLAYVAAVTSRVRLGTSILLAALRRPVVLAKTTATLDVLSGGRLDLGVGVGWQREEYEAAGLDFSTRGRQLDHTLAVCRTLWREQRASYEDDLGGFEHVHQAPKPRQPGGVPIWVSGTVNDAVLRRLARFGAGWIPWGDAAADLATAMPRVRDGVRALGRDPDELRVVGTLPRDLDGVPAMIGLGVTDFRANLPMPDDPSAAADELSALVQAFRRAAARG